MIRSKWSKWITLLLNAPLIFLILLIGIYPLQFFLVEGKVGILHAKSDALLSDWVWKTFFYMHISFGGIALLVGWLQFIQRLRNYSMRLHRTIGKVYVFCVWLSALGVGYIGFFAEGGLIAFLGFMIGGLIWAYTTIQGYRTIWRGRVIAHQKWMIYSYAMCAGAVTLRIWLPLLMVATNDFTFSYQIVSWMAWAPNLVVAYLIAKKKVTADV
jgi:hypothetical protein